MRSAIPANSPVFDEVLSLNISLHYLFSSQFDKKLDTQGGNVFIIFSN